MNQQEQSTKAQELIHKNKDLLDEKKFYEFAQKIKLLANRKIQSKKIDEAVSLFYNGADILFSNPQVQQNIPLELIDHLVQAYISQPGLLTPEAQKLLLITLQKRSMTRRKLDILKNLIFKTGQPTQHLQLSNFYLNFEVQNQNFARVQKVAAYLDQKTAINFIQKWVALPSIFKNEVPAIWCRMVIQRGLLHGIDDAQQLFRKVSSTFNDEPYTIFTGFLLKSVCLNSKESYQTLGRSYEQFLKSDPTYSQLYSRYGHRFFGIDKKRGGIFSLIQ